MITNERQYRITKAALKRFEEGLAALKASAAQARMFILGSTRR